MPERTPDDAEWEAIVASLRGPDTQGNADWPAAEDVDEQPDTPTDDSPDRPEPPTPQPARSTDEPVIIWRGSHEDIDAEIERAVPDEHFVPPDPPPLPRADAVTWAAWIAVIGAPLILLALTALGVSSRMIVTACIAGFLAGIGVLITRMRTHRDPYDPDDGAVV